MTEKAMEQQLMKRIRALGGKAYKFISPGNAGVPDRLVVLPGGRIVFAELKTRDNVLTALQRVQIDRLRALGCDVWVVRGAQGVDDFVQYCGELIRIGF